jgi:hypothetical protein
MNVNEATVTTLIIGFKTASLVLGGLITALSFRAYRRTVARSLFLLSVGFGIITFGTVFAGFVHQFQLTTFETSLLIESALLALGFLVVVLSLYTTQS